VKERLLHFATWAEAKMILDVLLGTGLAVAVMVMLGDVVIAERRRRRILRSFFAEELRHPAHGGR